jgi:hypothetical protein
MQQTLFQTDNRCSLTLESGGLVLRSPYIRELVEAVKSLPYAERRWDGTRKVWIIDPTHGKKVVEWITLYADEMVALPIMSNNQQQPVMKLLEVRYIGACKLREDGSSSAFGLVDGDWSVIFPESVLRTWFEGDIAPAEQPSEQQTLYQVLGVKKTVPEDELKAAYRRMVKQWHPDISKEPNTVEVFLRIQEAYRLLSNDGCRARYDAGLALQAAYEKQNTGIDAVKFFAAGTYRSPLRCGAILLEGVERVGRIEVGKIHAWQDVIRGGKTLVVSWPAGAKEPVEVWA